MNFLSALPPQAPFTPPASRSRADLAFHRLRVLLCTYGESNYIGEPVSIIDHCLQAAYFMRVSLDDLSLSVAPLSIPHVDATNSVAAVTADAEAAKAATAWALCPTPQAASELVIACLLHDVGHVLGLEAGRAPEMDGCGVANHEHVGADFLTKLGFNARVCKLARAHVQAKRFLTYESPDYYDGLTEASKTTLGFQGGPMTPAEASAFLLDLDHLSILLMRKCDEKGKVSDLKVPDLHSYRQEIAACMAPKLGESGNEGESDAGNGYVLSAFQLESFQTNSFLLLPGLLDFQEIGTLKVGDWVSEVAGWEKAPQKWLQHWEADGQGGKIMCRAENFAHYHNGLHHLTEIVAEVAGQLFETLGEKSGKEGALLFKEKINFKLAGGAGFSTHQDSPAYIGLATDHISVMVAADAATRENGCLQVCPGNWGTHSKVPLTPQGVVTPEAEASMVFQHICANPGDVLLFNGYLPHRSDQNNSDKNRRAVFLTYNPASQGDHHAAYYAAKHSNALGFDGAQTISFQGDFQGKIVE